MRTGTVCDFDSDGLFGLIDSDDGRLFHFNVREVPWARRTCEPGMRVRFKVQGSQGRAVELQPIRMAGSTHTPSV